VLLIAEGVRIALMTFLEPAETAVGSANCNAQSTIEQDCPPFYNFSMRRALLVVWLFLRWSVAAGCSSRSEATRTSGHRWKRRCKPLT
jgi:hypothetical protein